MSPEKPAFRIVLADPPREEMYYHADFPNLGLLYLIGALRRRYGTACDTLFLDGHRGLGEHLRAVAAFRPSLYGISFSSLTMRLASRVIKEVKSRFPGLPVICGGPMPTAAPREVLAESRAEVCVRGEGEAAICDIVDYYLGQRDSLHGIPGLVFRDRNGVIIETPPRKPAPKIDDLAFPAWDLVPPHKYKGWYFHRSGPQIHVLVSRGCPYDCNFCSNPVWKYAKPWLRLRSPGNIASEVSLLYKRGFREIYLSADVFNSSERWTLYVCRALEELGLRDVFYNANVRPDVITPELARAFRRIKLWVAHLGIETGNQRTLDGVGKRVRLEDVVHACRVLKAEGIKVFGLVMLYHAWERDGRLEWESSGDVDQTLRFCRSLFRKGLLDYMSWQVATPMPGSRLWDTAVKYRLLPGHEIRSIYEPNMVLPGVQRRDVNRSLRKGLWLKNTHMVRSGNVDLGRLTSVWANLRVMLGLGPPRGAY